MKYLLRLLPVLLPAVCAAGSAATPSDPVTFQDISRDGHAYSVVDVDTHLAKLRLYWQKSDGKRFETIANLKQWLEDYGQHVLFATNAGMFRPNYAPCGLHIEEGRQFANLNRKNGLGNFHLKPNGVFYLTADAVHIVTSDQYREDPKNVLLATQSGPMLVVDGNLHPVFTPDSLHRNIRSGVGVKSPNEVCFVLSRDEVTFYEIATLFRDTLACKNALYLDGVLSTFYLPNTDPPPPIPYAGILAVTALEAHSTK